MFDPDIYPVNLACWDGKVSEHWLKDEHPLDSAALLTEDVPPVAPPDSAEAVQGPDKSSR